MTAVPAHSHLADDFIKPCDCLLVPLSMATGFIQGVGTSEGLNQTRTHNVLNMVAV